MKHFALKSKNVIVDGEMKAALVEVKEDFIYAIHAYEHDLTCEIKDFGDVISLILPEDESQSLMDI